ncbi:NAD(P)-binding protein [Paracoccaceae bacterium]|nr:NAD(P)-binding protein [Paracoccaceae bacterium]
MELKKSGSRKKIGIVGAGLSGLTLAKKLSLAGHEIFLFDRSPLGIASYEVVDGIPIHHVGGHCLSQKNESVVEFIYKHVLPVEYWRTVERKALVELNPGINVSYPIELSVGQSGWRKDLVKKIISELTILQRSELKNPLTLHEYLEQNFGKTLTQLYFNPYNTKIWCEDPKKLDYEWVKDKTPQVSIEQILNVINENNHERFKDTDHAVFKYPKINESGTNKFLRNFSKLHQIIPEKIQKISKIGEAYSLITDEESEYEVDTVIYTARLDALPKILGCEIKNISNLEINSVTVAAVRGPSSDFTWKYIPDKDLCFHRIINMSYFSGRQSDEQHIYAIETTGIIDKHKIIRSIENYNKEFKILKILSPKLGYIKFKPDQQSIVHDIKKIAHERNIYLCGRFATWSYDNADICISHALQLAETIIGHQEDK